MNSVQRSTSWVAFLLLLIQDTITGRLGVAGARFASDGPVLTINLRDPSPALPPLEESSDAGGSKEASSAKRQPWLPVDLSSLRPNLVYSISSQQPPLPNWLPSLTSLTVGAGYQHGAQLAASSPMAVVAPSWMETTAKFDFPELCQVQVQPSHDLPSGTTSLLLQLSRGAHYAWAKVVRHRSGSSSSSSSTGSGGVPHLAAVQASALFRVPLASLAAVRVTPRIDLARREVTCDLEAVTGGPGRTRALLHLEYERPTLAVQYQPDPRHLIRPVIDLYSGRIVYQWILALTGGGSLNAQVDPDRDVTVQWNDPTPLGGSWLTNVRLPLEKPWRADLRVRRQFRF